jgi:hypothetical protein
MSLLAVSCSVTVIVVEEDGFVDAVDRKCGCSDAQPGERSLESIPSGEGPSVSPHLTVQASLLAIFKLPAYHLYRTFVAMDLAGEGRPHGQVSEGRIR